METNLFTGQLVRLVAEEPRESAELFYEWGRDSEYLRLEDSFPALQWSQQKIQEFIEKDLEKEPSVNFFFLIRLLSDNRLVGGIGLEGIHWNHGDAWVGIGIGKRADWGRGYGTDAMRVILRYAFGELNLWRVSLTVFEYNPRAVRSYEKAGFKIEGRARRYLNREGRRWDMIFMGILRDEWLERESG